MADLTEAVAMRAAADRQVLVSLLARISDGDQIALAQFYARTSARLNALLLRMLRDEGSAQEVLQDVYLMVWHRSATFDPTRASPMTWLLTVARNKAIDRLRVARMVNVPLALVDEAALADATPTALDRITASERDGKLLHCLEQLEIRQQSAIRAAFFDGLTYDALASRDGVPLGTMKSWIRRGLLRLRDCMDG